MSTGRKLLFSLLPLLILLVGGELLFRALGWPTRDPNKVFEHNEPYWITDPDLHEQPFPHRETGGVFHVSTDHQGLRYPLHSLQKPPGTFRIAFLGCSTTFGWGVDDAESYPARVESLLRAEGRDDVEVINAGQPGYTSFQGLWLYRHVLRRYHPDLVFFGYVVQDARRAAYTDRSQAMLQRDARFLKDHLLYRSRLYLGLRYLVDRWRMEAKERAPGEEGVYRVPPEEYVQNIRAFDRLTREDGARLVLFGFPLERAGYTAYHRRILAAAAAELGLPHLDFQDEMERLSRQQVLYFPQDRGHANAAGNDVIARHILAFLHAQHLLPLERP